MTGRYTNNIQAAILYEGGDEIHPSLHLNAFRMEMLNRQLPLKVVQEDRNFVLMAGPGEFRILVTYFARPADVAVFAPTLGSAVTTLLMPDARERVRRHTAHVLVEVHHGVMGGVTDKPEIAGFFNQIGMQRPGATLREFNMRVEILGEVCRHLLKVQPASVIHWTQSNMLVAGEQFTAFLNQQQPSMLTVHPKLFAGKPVPGFSETPAGVLTLGGADYIGREIYVAPAPIPWVDLYEAALAFMRVALVPNGYIVPDDETFGPENGDYSYRVRHLAAEQHPIGMREPSYALTLRFSRQHSYTTMEHETRTLVPGGMRSVAASVEADKDRRRELVADWEQKERAAKAVGNSLQLYRKGEGGQDASPGSPPRFGGGFTRRTAVFGRKH
ncbi:hypothetical protein HNQ96_002738 [Aminobacter lissarensis]|uniref:Uncharacterized protein n=1 Tax=Aminobacter carboxidus TaxID=376165 RepID=A0A8E1WEA5_9HYPH|nr:hypothetical protein [Aminobacter lissarensis]MBB6466862.1 hypothetical protein [Aminobacter lissarensis]